MTLDGLLEVAAALERAMDKVVDRAQDDLWVQAQCDWAWYRFATSAALIRERGAGLVAASLARGLLEQASYWDWAVATGLGAKYLIGQASVEYLRLADLAADIDDHVWLGWILPPGVVLTAGTGSGMPRSASEAVKRIGGGLARPVLAPLQFRGLYAANRLLDLLAHGNLAAALVMAPGGGSELPDALAAAIIHVAATGATAVVLAHLDPPADVVDELTDLALQVAHAASQIHGLPVEPGTIAPRPARARRSTALDVRSEIERMPRAASTTTAAAASYLKSAVQVAHLATSRVRDGDAGAAIAWAAFQMSWSQMLVLRGVVDGTLGKALLPFAARALLEDGARWAWLRAEASRNPSGDALRAIVGDSKRHIEGVRAAMTSAGVAVGFFDALTGYAGDLLHSSGDHVLPPTSELLPPAYLNASGVESARPMYSVLSQFVHATPLAALHLQRDRFPSITAPMYAVAVEAACRGFWNIATTTLVIACELDDALESTLSELKTALEGVTFDASIWHSLG